jgi:hypothetical protein
MNARTFIAILCTGAAMLTHPPTAAAHRLDEYLQASRIAVGLDRVEVEMDLTPGAAVAPGLIALIDANRDGEISSAEGENYARLVLNAAKLQIDDEPRSLEFVASRFPAIQEMNEGVGVIRVRSVASVAVFPGRHRLFFENTHQPEISVYLANALVPDSDRIQIAAQERDARQHELRFDYSVSPKTAAAWPPSLPWIFCLSALASLWFVARVVRSSAETVR